MIAYDRVVAVVMDGKPAVPTPTAIATPPALGDCRHCGRPAFGADETGPVHRCCINAVGLCPACAASRQMRRR